MSERYGSRERNYLRGCPRSREDARSEPTRRAQPRRPEAAGVQKGGRRGGCTAPGFCRLSREATLGAVVNHLEWASDKIIRVTTRVFHSPVLFGLLYSVSLAAVLVTHRRQNKEG